MQHEWDGLHLNGRGFSVAHALHIAHDIRGKTAAAGEREGGREGGDTVAHWL